MPKRLLGWISRGLMGPDSPAFCAEIQALVEKLDAIPEENWHRRATRLNGERVFLDERWTERLGGTDQVSFTIELGERTYSASESSKAGQIIAPLYDKVKRYQEREAERAKQAKETAKG